MSARAVPVPRERPLAALFETIRYEAGAWPLWRWDKNLRYVVKSLLHRPTPWSISDRAHWQASQDYLASGRWRRRPARRFRLLAGGDLMWIRSGWSTAMSAGVRALMDRADAVVVNLETPVVPERPVPRLVYETLHYNAPAEYLDALRSSRPRVVSLCNNHALDQGLGGLRRTREVALERGLLAVGGARVEDAVTSFEAGGLRVGVCGFTYGINHLVGPPPSGVPLLRLGLAGEEPDFHALGELLARARAAGPDLVVVAAHWSFEYEYWPGARAREHALRLVELGADVVLGASPHVLSPVEIVSVDGADLACPSQVRRGGPPGFALVAWSLGNLSSIMPTLACQVGALLEGELGLGAGGGVELGGLRATATVCGRGLGDALLDARTLTLSEYALERAASAHAAHAARILGPLMEESS